MSQQTLYPSEVDLSTPFSPELWALWDKAKKERRKLEFKALLWKVPLWVAGFFLLPRLTDAIGLGIGFGIYLYFASFGFLGLFVAPGFDYSASDDRKTAKFKLEREFTLVEIPHLIARTFRQGNHSLGGVIGALFKIGFGIVLFPLFLILAFPVYFNNRFWLSDFRNIEEKVRENPQEEDREHVRGTEMLPSETLSGAPPESEGTSDGSMEVLDGRIKLGSDGGVRVGMMSFDANSAFESFEANGMTLTRTDPALLRVSYEGEDHAFLYNGSTWSKV